MTKTTLDLCEKTENSRIRIIKCLQQMFGHDD